MQIDNRADRAASFGTIGEEYHRLRPSYPDDAVDWMLFTDQGRTPARVLDLGAGSGKLTDSLVARGLEVVAVDPSEQMLDVLRARHPQVEVHVATAESLPLPDASVDAVVIGQAWHWMDPLVAGAEIERVLRPGGSLAMAWNKDDESQPWLVRFADVQRVPRGIELNEDAERDPSPGPQYAPLEEKVFSWVRPSTGEDFLQLHKTHSAWLVADEQTRADRERQWREILADTGHEGAIELDYTTEVMRTHLL